MVHVTRYEFGISAIDSTFYRPMLDAIHLVVEGDQCALIDTGTNRSVPLVLDALAEHGLTPAQVKYVMLTHIHLDHAGGASQLMGVLPNAALTVHPRGARHMADPSKLMAGTIAVYGEALTRENYGEILPIEPSRIIETPHQTTLAMNGREFTFLDTPGHARHHVCILDHKSGHIFTGDTFGLSYRELDRDGMQFIFPSTTPVQFDPDALHGSIDLIAGHRPGAVYVTHYSQVRDIPRLTADLHRLIDAHAALGRACEHGGAQRLGNLIQGLREMVLAEAQRQQWPLTREALLKVFEVDIPLNAAGIDAWLRAHPNP